MSGQSPCADEESEPYPLEGVRKVSGMHRPLLEQSCNQRRQLGNANKTEYFKSGCTACVSQPCTNKRQLVIHVPLNGKKTNRKKLQTKQETFIDGLNDWVVKALKIIRDSLLDILQIQSLFMQNRTLILPVESQTSYGCFEKLFAPPLINLLLQWTRAPLLLQITH